MAEEARRFGTRVPWEAGSGSPQDELRAIGAYLHALMTDVTEARSSLTESQSQLLTSEKLASIGKLAASVAHEMRNPLTSIRMRLFSVRRAIGEDPQYEDDFRVMSEELARLESIVRDVLEFSRPRDVRPEPCSISVLVDNTLELVGPQLEEKNIRLTFDYESNLPRILTDQEQMKQVFLNLLVNASEAMEGGGSLLISAAVETDEVGRPAVVVRFQDTGTGVDEDARLRVFEPFFSTKEEGTGLGLSIAAQIMAQHRGRLVLEPSTGEGSRFAVWIPCAQEEQR